MSILQILIHFIVGFVTSFLGSIPLGSINAGVARISMTRNISAALLFIAGASIAELFYSFISIQFSGFILTIPKLEFYIRIISIPVFILLGIGYFISKNKTEQNLDNPAKENFLIQGLSIGFLNPLQIPFWLAYGSYYLSVHWIVDDFILLNVFTLGVVAGSVSLLIIIAKIASYYGEKVKINHSLVNNITGVIFILLALYQILIFLFEKN